MSEPSGRQRRVSSSDVAREAGVSRTTVSFVLNDSPGQRIPHATRTRVLDAAQRLGYTPSAEAKALASGHSAVVICLLPAWPVGGPISLFLSTLSAHLSEAGYTMLSHHRGVAEPALSGLISSITPAVVLAIADMSADEVDQAHRRGIKLMRWSGNVPGLPDVSGLRQEAIGRTLAGTLVDLGHERIGYVATSDDRFAWFSEPRLAGCQQLLSERGLAEAVTAPADRIGQTLDLWLRDGVTAIAAYNDEVAFHTLLEVKRRGLDVPGDVAIMGVDNLFVAAVNDPGLTSIDFELSGEARVVAAKLVAVATGAPQPPALDSSASMRVVFRDSTGHPGPQASENPSSP